MAEDHPNLEFEEFEPCFCLFQDSFVWRISYSRVLFDNDTSSKGAHKAEKNKALLQLQ